MNKLFEEIHRVIMLCEPDVKCDATFKLADRLARYEINHASPAHRISVPGLPTELSLVAPRALKRRGISTQKGRNVLMHSIAHIEFNAINLALDAAYRFRQLPHQYYQDWLTIAADEARHFLLLRDYLRDNNCEYGDFVAHNGLWEMAVQTDGDAIARMALVPRVLEARGLDVTPGMIERLRSVGDSSAIEILQVIYQDEIGHVKTGSHWFFYLCRCNDLEPRETFLDMVKTHLHGALKGPFNLQARLLAGFSEMEMAELSKLA